MNREAAAKYMRSALDDGDVLEAEAIAQAIMSHAMLSGEL